MTLQRLPDEVLTSPCFGCGAPLPLPSFGHPTPCTTPGCGWRLMTLTPPPGWTCPEVEWASEGRERVVMGTLAVTAAAVAPDHVAGAPAPP